MTKPAVMLVLIIKFHTPSCHAVGTTQAYTPLLVNNPKDYFFPTVCHNHNKFFMSVYAKLQPLMILIRAIDREKQEL
jgi:hypothetical protein